MSLTREYLHLRFISGDPRKFEKFDDVSFVRPLHPFFEDGSGKRARKIKTGKARKRNK